MFGDRFVVEIPLCYLIQVVVMQKIFKALRGNYKSLGNADIDLLELLLQTGPLIEPG